MDSEYTWILRQRKNCRQYRLLTLTYFIGQFLHPVGRERMGLRVGRYFSQLQVSVYLLEYMTIWCKI